MSRFTIFIKDLISRALRIGGSKEKVAGTEAIERRIRNGERLRQKNLHLSREGEAANVRSDATGESNQ